MPHFASFALDMLDARGRCNRHGFLALAILMLVLQAALGIAMYLCGADLQGSLAHAFKAAFIYVAFVASAKRLHDVGRSAWWMLGGITALVIWCLALSIAAVFTLGPDALRPGAFWSTAVVAVSSLPALGMLLWLHFAKGEPRENCYGPVPHGQGFARHRHQPAGLSDPSLAGRSGASPDASMAIPA